MLILDTNIISELLRPTPAANVEAWLASQDASQVYLAAVSEAELRYGVAIMPEGARRDTLVEAIDGMLREDFHARILPFDSAAAIAYASIAAYRRTVGRPISQFDCQIAAIGYSQCAAVATRNIKDFEGCGVDLIDPWH